MVGGLSRGCGRAASGHANAVPAKAAMSFRLAILIATGPSIGGHALWIIRTIARLNTAFRDVIRSR
jgi:hypothetical protein